MKDESFLSRWHRRKMASTAGPAGPAADAPAQPTSAAGPGLPTADVVPAPDGSVRGQAPAGTQLPAIDSLTPESDFSPFMQADVAEHLKRRALKTLFQDPRFNVMDGLDVYIDDYSKPDPLPEGWLEKMNQVARLGEYHAPEQEPAEIAEKVEPAGSAPAKGTDEIAPAQGPPDASPATDSSDTADHPSPPARVQES